MKSKDQQRQVGVFPVPHHVQEAWNQRLRLCLLSLPGEVQHTDAEGINGTARVLQVRTKVHQALVPLVRLGGKGTESST